MCIHAYNDMDRLINNPSKHSMHNVTVLLKQKL